MSPKKQPGMLISYITVSYSSVAVGLSVLLVLILIVLYFLFPEPSYRFTTWVENKIHFQGSAPGVQKAAGQQQAHFTNIDGTVRVKKSNSNAWISASYELPLEKGDVISTESEGIAKVVFTDGTNYTLKPDSLIVVEENSANESAQTKVAITVTTGTVDLATANFTEGSKSQISVAGATASLAPDSAALVKNDPKSDNHEILVRKGSGDVTRNGETLHLGDYEKVSFRSGAPRMTRSKEIGPPSLIVPANMATIFSSGKKNAIDFSWSAVSGAKVYRVRVSRNLYFSSLVVDKSVSIPRFSLQSIPEGAYYWSVLTVGPTGHASIESERDRFTVVPRSSGDTSLSLALEQFIQYGHVIEVRGKTEPKAKVMVNGAEVPSIGDDGSFHYFTPALPLGENVLTITAQNARGGVNTQTRKVVIQ